MNSEGIWGEHINSEGIQGEHINRESKWWGRHIESNLGEHINTEGIWGKRGHIYSEDISMILGETHN